MKRKLFFAVLCIASALSFTAKAQWTSPGSDPVSGNTYYLYNIEAERFVTAANSWGKQMSITGTSEGLVIRTTEVNGVTVGGQSLSGWQLANTNNANKLLFRDDQNWGYTDKGSQDKGYVWNITKVNGVYRLQTAAADPAFPGAAKQYAGGNNAISNGRVYFGYNENSSDIDWLFLTAEQKNATNLAARAKLYRALMKASAAGANTDAASAVYQNSESTAEQLLAQVTALNAARFQAHLDNASDSDPRDITEFVLTNSDFTQLNISGWETNYVSGTQATNIGYQDNNSYQNANAFCNRFLEAWRSGNQAVGDGYLRQTVSDMPEGKYVLECDAIAVNQGNPSAATTGALLYINADGSDYTANLSTGNAAPQHFSTQFLFTGEGNVIFGLKTVSATCNWIAADNFKVMFYGIDLSAYETQLATEVASFDAIKASVEDAVRASLQTQVDALNIAYASSKTYAAAIANMQSINAYAAAYVAATAARDNVLYNNVIGTERTALTTAIGDAPTYADYSTYAAKTTALTTAYSAFTAAVTNYDALVTEIAKAKALGIESATADAYAATSSTTSATALNNVHSLMVDEYNYVNTNFSYAVDLGTWNASSNAGTMTSQHWDGTAESSYLEQGAGNLAYDLNSWTVTYDQNLSLPAGNYIFKVAGRTAADHVTINLNVTDETDSENPVLLGTVNDFPKGDVGLGINTSGATDFTTGEGHTYANNNNGRGWQWRYVKFTLANPTTVKVAVVATADAKYRWMSFCNATVQTDDADNVELMSALVALNDAKTAATLIQHTNTGTGVFQYDATADASLWSAYTTAKSNADAFTLAADTEVDDVKALTSALNTAISNYQNQALNAPESGKRYNVTIVEDGKAWNDKAITFIAGGRTDMGLYGVKYKAPANDYMNQALKFTPVDGQLNTYKVSAINVETGGEQYLTTGTTYPDVEGNNNDQIRTTDDASKAVWVKIEAAAASGQFQMRNVTANNLIANNNNDDMYTANSCNFNIAEASEASVAMSGIKAGKYATRIFPFTPVLPSGIKAYRISAIDGTSLTLEEVAEPKANVPYLLKNENAEDYTGTALTGYGTAAADTYTSDNLTGSFVAGKYVPKDSYVMQTPKSTGKQGFYQVENENSIQLGQYRAYLTVPAAGDVKSFILDGDETDGIRVAEAEQDGTETIYTLSGQRVQKAQKGIYIVNGKKMLVK